MIEIFKSQNKLTIESNKNVSYVRFLAYLLFALMLFSGLFRVPWHSQLQCHKNEILRVDCQLTEFQLFNYKPTVTKIENLLRATERPRENNTIILVAKNFWLFNYSQYYFHFVDLGRFDSIQSWDKIEVITKINLFIKNKNSLSDLTINYQLNWKLLLVTLTICLFIPILLILGSFKIFIHSSVKTVYQFDRDRQIIQIHQELNFAEDVVKVYGFDRLVDIQLKLPEEEDVDNPYRIILKFDDNSQYKLESLGAAKDIEKGLVIIKDFLNRV